MPLFKNEKIDPSDKPEPPRSVDKSEASRLATPKRSLPRQTSAVPNEKQLRKKTGGRRVSDRLKALLAKVVSVVSSDSINEAFFNLTDEIKEFFECQTLVIYSVNPQKTQLFSRNHISDEIIEKRLDILKSNLPGYVFQTGTSLNIKDVYDRKNLAQYPGLAHDASWDTKIGIKTVSVLVVPIFNGSKPIGVLEIINKLDAAPFSDQLLKLAEDLAESLGSALDKLENEEHKEKLQAIGLAIQEATVMEDILFETTKPIVELFDADVVNIFAVDKKQSEIYSKTKTPQGVRERKVPIGPGSIVGWVALERRMVNIDNVNSEEALSKYHPDLKYDPAWDQAMGVKTKSMLCCPMIHENKLMGVLQVINTRVAKPFAPNHEKHIISISQMLAIAFHNNSRFVKARSHKFSYLINNGMLTPEGLESCMIKARKSGVDLETMLLGEQGIKRADLGKSLEDYYGVPYFGYEDSTLLPQRYFDGLNKNYLMKRALGTYSER